MCVYVYIYIHMINNMHEYAPIKVNLWILKSKFLMMFMYHQKFIILKKSPFYLKMPKLLSVHKQQR